MNFKQLEAFYWVTQFGNHRQTADYLGLTQPAVSARIQSLEKDLGKVLIDRDAPGFVLTDEGIEVAEFAVQFLNLRDAMAGKLQDNHRRRLSIGLAGMAALTWGPLLRDLVADSCDLMLDVHVGSDLQIRRFVEAGSLDLAFTATGDRVNASFAVRYHVGWVARPDVVEGRALPMSPEELRNLPLVLYPKTSPIFMPVAESIEDLQGRPAPRHYGNSLATICEMLRLGYGASALALTALEKDIEAGLLLEIPATEPLPYLEVACTHANRARQKHVSKILKLAQEAAKTWASDHERFATYVDL